MCLLRWQHAPTRWPMSSQENFMPKLWNIRSHFFCLCKTRYDLIPKSSIQSTSIQLQLNSTGYPFNLSMLSTLNSILLHVSSMTQKLKKLIVQTWEPRALEISKNTYQLQFLKSTCTSTKNYNTAVVKVCQLLPPGGIVGVIWHSSCHSSCHSP